MPAAPMVPQSPVGSTTPVQPSGILAEDVDKLAAIEGTLVSRDIPALNAAISTIQTTLNNQYDMTRQVQADISSGTTTQISPAPIETLESSPTAESEMIIVPMVPAHGPHFAVQSFTIGYNRADLGIQALLADPGELVPFEEIDGEMFLLYYSTVDVCGFR
eukprot:844629_1